MKDSWIPLQSIPPEGTTFVLENDPFWLAAMEAHSVACRIVRPLRAEVFVLPREEGVLMRGTFSGEVALPCNRCAEDSFLVLEERFSTFETYPPEEAPLTRRPEETPEPLGGHDEEVIRDMPRGRGLEINPAALVWQEFCLALPVKPLCAEGCKGLCAVCGCNRNTAACDCEQDPGDPRLAALRALKPGNR